MTVVARTNVVYEADLAVHFNLIANNDQVVFIDPVTDPYPDTCDGAGGGSCSGPYLNPNIATLSTRIGNDNFDIGHLVTRVIGGVAYLSSTCGTNKAGGISGIPRGGDVDPFAALVVVHEIGHQMGANHTFSGTRGRCGNNANLSTAWEAGGGSSPMAYPGACPVGGEPPSDNLVLFADPFFHHGSLNEMQAFLTGTSATCAVQTITMNRAPVITSAMSNTQIPPGTPFALSVVATDADNDVLTYSWEQRDNGVARPLTGTGSADNGMGALFRVFPSVLSPTRTFPQWSDILSGVPTPGERLPTVTGATRRFRVVVRDNHPGMSGTAIRATSLQVVIPSNTTPFGVVAPGEGDVFPPGDGNIVTWTVGNTDLTPILCSEVTIWLSTDNGATFTHNLGTFPNTGSANVTIPRNITSTGRVRVDANGEIFFAVSRPFGLRSACAADRNQDNIVNSADFFHFMGAFFDAALGADFNNDGVVYSQDFFDFLAAFFAGC